MGNENKMNDKKKAQLKYKLRSMESDNLSECIKLDLSKTKDYHKYLALHGENRAFQKASELL